MAAPARVAIVGSGPAGFYTVEALLRAPVDCTVDMFERLPMPHGLVRYGVAPDHQKLKQVIAVFDRIADDPRFALHAAVEVGRDMSLAELRELFDAVVVATGNGVGRRLGIPGESLANVVGSAPFVGWYNGHPDHLDTAVDLTATSAVVVGVGNVALDVCRLLALPIAELQASDMPQPVEQAFARRAVRAIHVIGRGAVTATKFTFKEFREAVGLPGVRVHLPQAAAWPEASFAAPADEEAARVAQWLQQHALRSSTPAGDAIDIHFWFHAEPREIVGPSRARQLHLQPARGAVAAFGNAPTAIDTGLVVTCIGYRHEPVPGVPFDAASGTVRHRGGQVLDVDGRAIPGLFVSGWAKRGATGVIGTNRADGYETAATLIAALPELVRDAAARRERSLAALFDKKRLVPISYAQWRLLDRHERLRGGTLGKPREKLLSHSAALAVLRDELGVDGSAPAEAVTPPL